MFLIHFMLGIAVGLSVHHILGYRINQWQWWAASVVSVITYAIVLTLVVYGIKIP